MNEFFLKMIQHLRKNEEVMLYSDDLLPVSNTEQQMIVAFLADEFKMESVTYPANTIHFDPKAALWAAQTIYTAAQLILYRKDGEKVLTTLFPDFPEKITDSAVLSADLCLRFLPEILRQIKLIDMEDELIVILEKHLTKWHYSGISYPLPIDLLDFEPIVAHPYLIQMYANKVMALKRLDLANHPALTAYVRASMGMYSPELWGAFES
jgi:MoxR-vWA-beta-propeller ternary system domain bpX4